MLITREEIKEKNFNEFDVVIDVTAEVPEQY